MDLPVFAIDLGFSSDLGVRRRRLCQLQGRGADKHLGLNLGTKLAAMVLDEAGMMAAPLACAPGQL